MKKRRSNGRDNQRRRTRKELLAAAARVLKQGRTPDMDDVAAEAMVSRATAYRYFPSVEALLAEAPVDDAVADPESLFAEDDSTDSSERVVRAEAMLHEVCYRNQSQLRRMLAASLERAANGTQPNGVPLRQNRRTPLIDAALTPSRDALSKKTFARLRAALALVFGTESMIVFQDVLNLSEREAVDVKQWACRSLVAAALAESKSLKD